MGALNLYQFFQKGDLRLYEFFLKGDLGPPGLLPPFFGHQIKAYLCTPR